MSASDTDAYRNGRWFGWMVTHTNYRPTVPLEIPLAHSGRESSRNEWREGYAEGKRLRREGLAENGEPIEKGEETGS
ncbi:hypothetical protein [Streptomyces sp. 5-10]|uniref:hypothetical protein n=1 Tax=Streptomyces sp. 5-10 TaxID=878925 RepID=UPI00168A6D12|nr:hypothetical protein [Streptomyces sp. 5-10]MBD3004581.1 hypothetical protein [Streptomyces sp. 5-10]